MDGLYELLVARAHVLAGKGDRRATVAEIAKVYAIAKSQLMKAAQQLGVGSYVETGRGKGGGLRLVRPPRNIVLGDVVRRTKPDMMLVSCVDADDASCTIFSGCGLRSALPDARDAFFAALDRRTLADLMPPRASLQEFLALKPNARTVRQQPLGRV